MSAIFDDEWFKILLGVVGAEVFNHYIDPLDDTQEKEYPYQYRAYIFINIIVESVKH